MGTISNQMGESVEIASYMGMKGEDGVRRCEQV